MTELLNIDIWAVAKIFVLIAMSIYIVFAFVIVRQSKIMTDTLELGLEKAIRTVALAHMLFAIGTFVIALIIL